MVQWTYGKIQKCVEKVDKNVISQQKPHVRGGYGCYKGEKRKLLGLCVAKRDANVNQKMSFERMDQNSSRGCAVWAVHTWEDLDLGRSMKFGFWSTHVLWLGGHRVFGKHQVQLHTGAGKFKWQLPK